MAALIDSSVWVAIYRASTPEGLRRRAAEAVNRADAHGALPVLAEVCGALPGADMERLRRHLGTLPLLSLPEDVWEQAAAWMAQSAERGGRLPLGAALIGVTARHHGAELVACDPVVAPLLESQGVRLRFLT
jgi:predicted nucleic acid-binding protein